MRISMRRADIKWVRFLVKTPDGSPTTINFSNIYFTVKKSSKDREFVFQKSLKNGDIYKLADGDYQFKIGTNDTKNLQIRDYVFDFQVSFRNILRESFAGTFALKEEISYGYGENEDDDEFIQQTTPQVDDDSVVVLQVPDYHIIQLETPEPVVLETTIDYSHVTGKPSINNVTVDGDLSLEDLGIPHAPLSAADTDEIIDAAESNEQGG